MLQNQHKIFRLGECICPVYDNSRVFDTSKLPTFVDWSHVSVKKYFTKEVAHGSGVYVFVFKRISDGLEYVSYVGSAVNVKTRLKNHFQVAVYNYFYKNDYNLSVFYCHHKNYREMESFIIRTLKPLFNVHYNSNNICSKEYWEKEYAFLIK